MSAWSFEVLDVAPTPYAAAPELTVRLRVRAPDPAPVHAMALRCQVRIEPQRRGYDPDDEAGLRALFGDRDRWSQTLRPFQWLQAHTTVQGFTGETVADLSLPCTYDFDVAASRYLHALGDGAVPLAFLFSGVVFRGEDRFSVERVPWDSEARHSLPVRVWSDLMATFFPHAGWLRLDHDVLDALADYRARHGLVSWEETISRLLADQQVAQPVAQP